MKLNQKHIVLLAYLCGFAVYGQREFTKQDSLRGSITPEREWWDLTYYDLDVAIDPEEKFLSGSNAIHYRVLEERQVLQVDLQAPLKIESVTQDGKALEVEDVGSAHFVQLVKPQHPGDLNVLTIRYSGHPKKADNAPWDGGFSWKKDDNNKPFIATSCQGLGASVWWPNKDHMYDEVDSMAIHVTAPKNLVSVANGRLRKVSENAGTKTYHWFVSNPINNYGVNVNIGDYVHFGEKYQGEKGVLDMDYYVLSYNLEKAKEQFRQAPMMMKAFEHWFGPYPFYEDSFKLVEVPYLGMEHQSSVTYGNKFGNGYLGRDLSRSGWGLKFDYIIIHESGHEWFANNITYKDIADMWIHESFTSYSESIYLDYYFGKEAADAYIIGLRGNIRNDRPIIGPYDVNQEGSGDMYPKGANMIHTLRQLVNDDVKWREVLRGMNREFYHQTVSTSQVESFLSKATGMDLAPFFDQYLRTTKIPELNYKVKGTDITYRYTNIVPGFRMPVRVYIGGDPHWLYPSGNWKTEVLPGDGTSLEVDPNFYIDVKRQSK